MIKGIHGAIIRLQLKHFEPIQNQFAQSGLGERRLGVEVEVEAIVAPVRPTLYFTKVAVDILNFFLELLLLPDLPGLGK